MVDGPGSASAQEEQVGGWIRLALTIGAAAILPLWGLVAAMLAQVHRIPDVVTAPDGTRVLQDAPDWATAMGLATAGAVGMVVLIGAILGGLVLVGAVGDRQAPRPERIDEDALPANTPWRVERVVLDPPRPEPPDAVEAPEVPGPPEDPGSGDGEGTRDAVEPVSEPVRTPPEPTADADDDDEDPLDHLFR